MNGKDNIKNRSSKSWEIDNILISHNVIEYHGISKSISKDDNEYVRMHFGL